MCGGFSYNTLDTRTGRETVRKVFFPIPHAQIPVLEEDGDIHMAQWGRRQGEDSGTRVPVTGWARLSSIEAGKWEKYHPRRVRIPALQFMEKDESRTSHWFDMDPQTALLGLEIDSEDRSFVYIVTNPAAGPFKEVHDRWPVLVYPDMTPLTRPAYHEIYQTHS